MLGRFDHILTFKGYLIYCAVVGAVYGERTIVAQVGSLTLAIPLIL